MARATTPAQQISQSGDPSSHDADSSARELPAATSTFADVVADRIIQDFAPQSVLLVASRTLPLDDALRKRGIVAECVEWSADSIDELPSHTYDLTVCLDAPDSLSVTEADRAIAGICDRTGNILFSAGATTEESTPVNLFARHGFILDVDYSCAYLSVIAVRYLRSGKGAEIARLNTALSELQAALLQTEASLRDQIALNDGIAIKVARRLNMLARHMAPPGTHRHRAVRRSLRLAAAAQDGGIHGLVRELEKGRYVSRLHSGPVPGSLDEQYQKWLVLHAPDETTLNEMTASWRAWQRQPLISIILASDPDARDLSSTSESILAQVYGNWELCIPAPANAGVDTGKVIARLGSYSRVKPVQNGAESSTVSWANLALAAARGEFVLLLDTRTVLQPHALFAFVRFLQTNPDADVLYGDEDRIMPSGRRGDPRFKPDWSPHLLLSCNYMGTPVLVRRELLERAGGLRSTFEDGGYHDIYLRVTESARQIGHVDEVLASRSAASPEARHPVAEDDVEKERRAIADALHRRNVDGRVERASEPGQFHVRLAIQGAPRVEIIIPTRDRLESLRACVHSVETRSSYRNFTVTIVDNDSRDPATLEYLGSSPHQVVRLPGEFNYSRIINTAARHTTGEHLLLLNNDVTVITPDWLEALLEQSQRPEVGAVGARLLFRNGAPQHEGIGLMRYGPGNLNLGLHVIRDVVAVTGACAMVRRGVFEEVHGMDESMAVAYGDVDLCMRIHARGYWIVYTPLAELYHEESMSRGRLNPAHDAGVFTARWGEKGEQHDPFFSRHILNPNPLELRVE